MTITSSGLQTFCLRTLFGMSANSISMYKKDNSGVNLKPEPDSDVAPHNRVGYLTSNGIHQLLIGDKSACFYQRWSSSLNGRIRCLGIENEWVELPNMVDYWMQPSVASMNEALTGPLLECINPHFTRDFIDFFPYAHGLMKGLPKWCMPQAYKMRDSLIQNVKQWHAVARARYRESDVCEAEDRDPWWGCQVIRERQTYLGQIDNWDHDSIASSDFGLLWG